MLKNAFPDNKKLIISGMGADGIFGDKFMFNMYKSDKPFWRVLGKQPFLSLMQATANTTTKGKRFTNLLKEKSKNRSFNDPNNMLWTGGQYGLKQWVLNEFNTTEEAIVAGRQAAMKNFENRSIYVQLEALDYLGNITQSIWSKLAEGNGKIMYYPYFYEPVVDVANSLDLKIKLKRPKYVLLKVAHNLGVPKFITHRKKSGFGINRKDWAVQDGPLHVLRPLIAKVFDEHKLDHIQSTDPQKAMLYWNVINYALWKRICVDGESKETLLKELQHAINRL